MMKKTENTNLKTVKDELGLITDGAAAIVRERSKQNAKGHTPQSDYENNAPGVLISAARALLNFDIHTRISAQPKGWDTYTWQKQCIKPERERLAVAGAWIASELDRYYFHDGNKEEK